MAESRKPRAESSSRSEEPPPTHFRNQRPLSCKSGASLGVKTANLFLSKPLVVNQGESFRVGQRFNAQIDIQVRPTEVLPVH